MSSTIIHTKLCENRSGVQNFEMSDSTQKHTWDKNIHLQTLNA